MPTNKDIATAAAYKELKVGLDYALQRLDLTEESLLLTTPEEYTGIRKVLCDLLWEVTWESSR